MMILKGAFTLTLIAAAYAELPLIGSACIPLDMTNSSVLCLYAKNTGDICQWEYGVRGKVVEGN